LLSAWLRIASRSTGPPVERPEELPLKLTQIVAALGQGIIHSIKTGIRCRIA